MDASSPQLHNQAPYRDSQSGPSSDRLHVREWTLAEWQASEQAWTCLLSRSGQDALFLSWSWMTLWWDIFGAPGSLCMLAVYRAGDLVGIAPLYRSRAGRRLVPVRSLQFIGTSWRDSRVIISEYLDVIAIAADRDDVRAAVIEYLLAQSTWSELVVSFTGATESWASTFAAFTKDHGVAYHRTVEHCTSHQADLGQGFEAYLAKLGQSTRRSVWHLRRRLGGPARARVEWVPVEQVGPALDDMNRLHALRWGSPAFTHQRLQFHVELAKRFNAGELLLSRLWVDGRVVSMLYDIRRGARQYNLKMAFDPRIERTFSLGLIHFGYAMEAAAAQGVTTYDFLAGHGMKTDYKRNLSQEHGELATVQLLKGAMLARLYRWYDNRKNASLEYHVDRDVAGRDFPAGAS